MFFTNGHLTEIKSLDEYLFDNTCELIQRVPSYILRTNLTGRFWEAMEDVMVGLDEEAQVIGVKGKSKRESCQVVAGNVT